MRNSAWTPAEDAILREAIANHWTITQMLVKLRGRSQSSIDNRARRLNMRLNDAHGIVLKAAPPPWTPEEDACLIPFLRDGGCRRRIAQEVRLPGRTIEAVEGRIRRLRLMRKGTKDAFPVRRVTRNAAPAQRADAPTAGAAAGSSRLHQRLLTLFERQAQRLGTDITTAMIALERGPKAALHFAAQRGASA